MFIVAGIHPSRARMSGSFESVRWNACVHRLDLGLYSHPKEFFFFPPWNGVRTHVNSKGKIPSTGKKNSPQRRIEPTTLHQTGQRAQHTTSELLRPRETFPSGVHVRAFELGRGLSKVRPCIRFDVAFFSIMMWRVGMLCFELTHPCKDIPLVLDMV